MERVNNFFAILGAASESQHHGGEGGELYHS